jgi:GAF domain-containing protein/HAMP domain-containing protein
MNPSPASQTMQILDMVLGLAGLILGLYILSLNARHTANRHASAVLLVSAINNSAMGLLLGTTDLTRAPLLLYLLAATSPAIQPLILLLTVALLKPEWLRARWRWIWWPIYALSLLPAVLTAIDVGLGTQLWYTGLPDQLNVERIVLSQYAGGSLSFPIRLLNIYFVSLLVFIPPLYVLARDKQATPLARRLAWLLLGAQATAMAAEFGLRGLGLGEIATLITNVVFVCVYGFAAFQQLISERRAQGGKLRVRLTGLVLAVTLPILVVVGSYTSLRAGSLLEQDAAERLQTSNQTLAANLSAWLDLNSQVLQQTATLPDVVSMDVSRQEPALKAMAAAHPYMYLVSTTDLKGINVARNDGAEPKDYSDRLWFRAARDGTPLALELVVGKTSGKPTLVMATPIKDTSGKIIGVAMAASELTAVAQQVERQQLRNSVAAYVVDAQNQVVVHTDPALIVKDGNLVNLGSSHSVIALRQGRRGAISYIDENGVRWRAYVDQLSNGWGVVVQQSEPEFLSAVGPFQRISWTMLVIGAAMLLLLAWLSIRQALRPIDSLAQTVAAVAAGDLGRAAPVESEDELGTLARAFNSMTGQLREFIGSLEQRVAERTLALEHQSVYLQASAEVGRAAASILEADRLITQAVELIRERFDLYYVGLFLLDEAGEWAVLRSGTGEAGQAMLNRGHRLQVGGGSMIGWSVANAQARVALEAGADAVRLATAELPDTRSEAALPLRSRGRVLGALTVQSTQPGAFDQDAVAALQLMADQVAVALDNARLFAQSQAALEAVNRASAQLSREAWANLLKTRGDTGYRSTKYGVTDAGDIWRPEMEQAFKETRTVQANGSAGGPILPLAVPIKVRGQTIGVVDTHKSSEAGDWTAEEVAVLETLAEQLGVALESARLYQDTQQRAIRERMIGEIASRMRESLDMETILRTTADEIYQALGLEEVTIRLVGDDGNPSTPA